MKLESICKHLQDREYMSGVSRDKIRVKATGEVFTPTSLVQEILDKFPPEKFDLDVTFLDPSCGDGQFLSEVLVYKLKRYDDQNEQSGEIPDEVFIRALKSIYGVEFKDDNVELCRARMLCGRTEQHIIDIVKKNIVHHDALTYDYSFNGTNYTDKELYEQTAPIKVPDTVKQIKPKRQKLTPVDTGLF